MEFSETLVKELLGGSAVKQLSKTSGAKANEVENVLSVALPVLLNGMQENAGTKKGEAALTRALSDHAGDDVSDVTAFLKKADTEDGAKILQHVLGDQNAPVQRAISQKANVSSAQTAQILNAVAPLLLALLGQQSQSSDSGIGSLLGSLLGSGGSGSGSLANVLLGSLLGGGSSGSSGSGSLLGSLLGGSSGDTSNAGDLLGSLLGGSSGSSGNSSGGSASNLGGLLLSTLLSDDDGSSHDGSSGGLLGSLLGGGSGGDAAASLLGSLFGDDEQPKTANARKKSGASTDSAKRKTGSSASAKKKSGSSASAKKKSGSSASAKKKSGSKKSKQDAVAGEVIDILGKLLK